MRASVQLLLATALLLGVACAEPQISSSSPYWMGHSGGVTLTVYGTGFSGDQFNQFDPSIGNVVKLVNDAETIDCKVIIYLTNTEKIVCSTGPRMNTVGSGVFYVKVWSDGVEATGATTVEYADWVAPKIDKITPRWALPGDLVEFYGWMQTNKFARTDPNDPAGTGSTSGVIITKVYMGGVDCEMVNETSGELYYLADNQRSLICLPTTKFIGPMNGTTYVNERGVSVSRKWGTYVDSQDRLFQYHTYPAVENVSPSSGSSMGNTLLTLTGIGFDPYLSKVQVWVGGAECEVQDVLEGGVTCLTPPQGETGPASGERGILSEIWSGEYVSDLSDDAAWAALDENHSGYTSLVQMSTTTTVEVTNSASGKLSGYFHAPHDGLYAFGTGNLNGDSMFLIATDGNADNKEHVHHWAHVNLTADTPAYFELRYRTTTSMTFRVTMSDYNTKYTYAHTAMGIDERHRVRINPEVQFETQRISVGGSPGDASLYLNGMMSDPINITDSEQIRSAVLALTDQECETQGENPKLHQDTNFELDEMITINPRGQIVNDIDAYCGKNAWQLNDEDPRLYSVSDELLMGNVNTHPYMCFALRGNVQSTMHVQFRWEDIGGNKFRTDGLNIEHGFTSTADTWEHRCINLQEVVDNSWISGKREAGEKLLLKYSLAPKPATERDTVYIDAFSFASENIAVVKTRPSALKNLGILISDVNVLPVENENAFDVEFVTGNCAGDFPLLGVTKIIGPSTWITDLASASTYSFTVDGIEVDISRTMVATHPVEGTWSLSIEDETIDGISYETQDFELDALVEAALGSSGMTVTRGGTCAKYYWDIEWNESPGRKELVSADVSGLVFDGTGISVNVERNREGKLWHDPIEGDFFTVRRTDPAVFVRVNGYSAACLGDCSFTYDDSSLPSLNSVTGSADISGSHAMTIIGTGFTSNNVDDYAVAVGDASCVVSAVTSTQVICSVAYLPAGIYPVSVNIQPVGGAQQPDPALSYTVAVSVTSVTPATGGTGGGYSVVVAGTGLPVDLDGWVGNSIALGAADCEVTGANSSSVTCIAPAGTGAVDVTINIGGTSSSLSSGFTYDASLSALLTSVSPMASSVIGGDLLTITGSGFDAGTDGIVMVGDGMCEVQSWNDTTITCTLPSLVPGEHAISVYTDIRGYASGSASVTYTLKVTASSSATGSVYGGTTLVIQGEGFGSDCSLLDVDLGNGVMCDVFECSDTEITCEIMVMPQTHVIRNTGVNSVHGPGYAWEPKNVKIREGDSIRWEWSKVDPLSQILYNVFETDSGTSIEYNNNGFNSGSPTSSGSYMLTFNQRGVTYYAGDPVPNNVVLSGKIDVRPPAEMAYQIVVSLGGIQADSEPSGASVSVNVEGCSPILETATSNCNSAAPSAPDADHLYFITDKCFTPSVTDVSASATQSISGLSGLQVAGGARLTITGSGLGSSKCQSQVFVGESACNVKSSSDNSVICDLDDYEGMVSLKPFPLVVKVVNRGIASLDVADFKTAGQISIVPVVTSFNPVAGSLEGGTAITIQGTGLQAFDGQATVLLGSYPCVVSDVTPTAITCTSSPAPEGAVNIAVRISAFNIDAVNNLASSVFTYSAAASPSVTSTALSGSILTISGSGFGTNVASVTVMLTPNALRRKRSIPEQEPRKPAIRYVVPNRNTVQQDVDSEFPRDTRMPRVRADLFDSIDSESQFWGKFTKTGAKTFEETKAAGAWRIGGTRRIAKQGPATAEKPIRVRRQAEATTVECAPTSVTDTTITCNAADLPAGSYELSVNVEGLGAASVDTTALSVSVSANVTSISPPYGSLNGGTLLTIAGAGFTPGSLTITVDGSTCDIESEATDAITCLTPAHAAGAASVVVTSGGVTTTSPVDFTYDTAKTPVLSNSPALPDVVCCGAILSLTGTDLKIATSDPEVTIDGELCTDVTATATSLTCTIPELAAGTYDVVLRDAIYGYSNTVSITYSFSVDSISPAAGGLGGVEATLSGTGFDPSGGSSVTVCDVTCEVISGGFGSITCVVPATVGGSTVVCDVVVTNPDATTSTLAGGFTYDPSLSSSVTSVLPQRGGTAGGTRITITGTDFASSGNTVTIGDSVCDIVSESSTEIVCDTKSHDGPGTFPVLVTVPNKGIATTDENGEFFYIDRWSSVFTWGGEPVPSEGQLVVIENGQTVLLDESTDVLDMLLIKGGHVVFDQEASSEIVLRAKYILIVEEGSLSIGSEEDPFMGDAVIELYGNAKSIELPYYGAKVLAVREGTLDIHGAPIPVTWTHLASTASAGDSSITLKQPVTWKAGDNIVIATTERRFMVNENEVRTIASVSGDGLTLTLTEALDYEHISIEQTFGSHTIETRAEVGLLTRNIKIRGNIDADFVEDIEGCAETFNPGQFETQTCFNGRYGDETATAQFGATVMLFGKELNKDLVSCRIEYVEVTEAGQAFQLGRYPLHFHLVGNVSTSYIRGCAVHRTYNRAVTIHAADYLTVEKNVVYNNMGHAIFTEDGVEQFNVIQYNLAVYTRTSASLLNVDITPSSYWVVHPNNIVRHNAAAGGTHFGYWYRLERHPSGPSATTSVCQNNAPMGEFVNNTAHSMGRYGFWLFSMDGYFPKDDECWGNNMVARWDGFTVWRCDRGAEVVFGGALQFNNFIALDNEHAGLEMVKVEGNFGLDDGPAISNSVLIGHSALTPEGCGDEASGIIAPKQYIFSIADTEFYNYDTNQCAALSGCSQCKTFQGGYQVQVAGLSFTNSPNKLKFQWEHETVWIDADGSLSGNAENKVVPDMGILPPSCTKSVSEFSVNPAAPGAVCDPALEFVRLSVKGKSVSPQSFRGGDLVLSNSYGNTTIPYRVKRLDSGEGWMAVVYSGETYDWEFEDGNTHTDIQYEAKTKGLKDGNYYFIRHTFMQSLDYSTTAGVEKNSSDAMPDPVTGFHGEYFYDESDNTLTYLVSKNQESRKKRVVFDDRSFGSTRTILFETYRCEYEGCVDPTLPPAPTGRPDNPHLWSNVETWKDVPVGSGGHPSNDTYNLPVEGDDIIIPADMWLVVDTPIPSLGRVTVYGALEFDDSMDHVFNATIIFAQGGTVVAGFSEDAPFTHNLSIILRGTTDPDDPDNIAMPMPDGTPHVGWKAMGMFGPLLLHGECPTATWAKLGETVMPGDTDVVLAEAADDSWVGKQVVITATGKEPSETEVRTVVAASGNTLTLDSALTYQHLGETYTLSDGTQYVMAGEVGLLTRNIVIEGSEYPGLETEGLGGRVLVSSVTAGDIEYKGSAQLSCVEFRNMGQKDFSDSTDPRFSLALHTLGTDDGTSYVKKCSFNKNFNSAIGVYGSNNFLFEYNVVYHTIGSGIIDEGEDNSFRFNLVSLLYFPGTFNGQLETEYQPWEGSFYLNLASRTVLEGNVVAGSELAGYRTYGELCEDDTNWINNEVHGATYGVMVWKTGFPSTECRRINDFYAWRITDTAFYMQHYASLLLENVVSVDSLIGTNQLVYAPHALSHMSVPKTATTKDSLFVGASPSYDCAYHDSNSNIRVVLQKNMWGGGIDGGNAGVMIGSFASSKNMAPKHAFHEVSSYPAINGASYITNVKFANYSPRSCGTDVAMISNKDADDAIHPVFVSGLTFLDTPEDNKLFLFEPNLGAVNPSDCVDMDCDGHKKVIITDTDGTFLGSPDATLTSIAEFEWDGDPSRGVGDYRIPIPLRQNADGTEITADEKFPNKGILRDDSCTLMSAWRGWKCTNLKHRMMVIESMDADTEIRRLSPIALIANPGVNGYVDLLNGPMDRGWCFGYTCQERISTFYSVVATGNTYEMGMTSTPPQVLRFNLLHTDPSEAVLLRIFFPKTQRYDVSVDGVYVPPTNIDNSKYPADYQLLPEDDSFLPTINDPIGTNYLQRTQKYFHLVLRGGSVIDIKTMPTIILSMGVVVDPDNFFEENIVQNLALMLGIQPENIRVTNVIRETPGRRTTTEMVKMEFMISSPPSDLANTTSSAIDGTEADILTREDLNLIMAKVINTYQENTAGEFNLAIVQLNITEPLPEPEEPAGYATQEFGSQITGGELYSNIQQALEDLALNASIVGEVFKQPSLSQLLQEVPLSVQALTIFDFQPILSVLSSDGDNLLSLGHASDPWTVTVELIGGNGLASLTGNTTVPYLNGSASFENLAVNGPGSEFGLTFTISSPSAMTQLTISLSTNFTVEPKAVKMYVLTPEYVIANIPFNITIVIVDPDTRSIMDGSVLTGQEMIGQLKGDKKFGALVGQTSFTAIDGSVSMYTVEGVSIPQATRKYRISAKANVEPAGFNLKSKSQHIMVLSDEIPDDAPKVTISMRVQGIRSKALKQKKVKDELISKSSAKLQDILSVRWSNADIKGGRKIVFSIDVQGTTENILSALQTVCDKMKAKKLKFRAGKMHVSLHSMKVDSEPWQSCTAKKFMSLEQQINLW